METNGFEPGLSGMKMLDEHQRRKREIAPRRILHGIVTQEKSC
jgi:hypothetical protein